MKSFGKKSWIIPQPVLIIGTYNKEGVPNAMNAAWGGVWDNNEAHISLGSHATTDNLDDGSDLTITFATEKTLVASDYVGITSARTEPDKIDKTGWKVTKAPNVNAPVFEDFPLTLECKITRKIDQDSDGMHIVVEIVNTLCREEWLGSDGMPEIEKMGLITYDPVHHNYLQLGKIVGKAFADGKKLR